MSRVGKCSHCAAGIAALLLGVGAGEARVLKITLAKTAQAFQGRTFGNTGPYEVIRGTAIGELDPADRRNAVITDIQFAPRNANGKVPYMTTFSILKPVDMTKANGILVYDVTNRGAPRFVSRFTRFVLANGPADLEFNDAGDGSVYKAGYVVLTSGWQGDVPIDSASGGREGVNVPVAKKADGSPITGPVIVRFASGAPGNGVVVFSGNANSLLLPGPGRTPASLDTSKADADLEDFGDAKRSERRSSHGRCYGLGIRRLPHGAISRPARPDSRLPKERFRSVSPLSVGLYGQGSARAGCGPGSPARRCIVFSPRIEG